MTDQLRSDLARRQREALVFLQGVAIEDYAPGPDSDHAGDEDDTLILLFMCCHPALTTRPRSR